MPNCFVRMFIGVLASLRHAGAATAPAGSTPSSPRERTRSTPSSLPFGFIENRGQWSTPARFIARKRQATLALEPDAIRMQLGSFAAASIGLVFEGGSPQSTLVGEGMDGPIYNFLVIVIGSRGRPEAGTEDSAGGACAHPEEPAA
jgi:hypothetical protein